MEVIATTKFARTSSKKALHIARQIQGMEAGRAAAVLNFVPKKTARLFAKTLKSAMANAENNHNLAADKMVILRAAVEQGPAFKRFRPVGRGSAHPYIKRTCHLRIILTDATPANAEAAETTAS